MNRIDSTFQRLKRSGGKALITYLMAGDPGLAETEELVVVLEKAGADIVELGVPFSDPIADGPVIQRAAERALRNGTTLRRILATVAAIRRRSHVPIVLMGYYNTMSAYGLDRFCQEAAAVGVDGLIVPDMPPEEAGSVETVAGAVGLHVIFLIAPTSTPERRLMVATRSRGFIYYVSITGITGAKLTDLEEVRRNVKKIQRVTRLPVAVGFGVSSPQDASQIAAIADAVVVGSAIVKTIDEHRHDSNLLPCVAGLVESLKAALAGGLSITPPSDRPSAR